MASARTLTSGRVLYYLKFLDSALSKLIILAIMEDILAVLRRMRACLSATGGLLCARMLRLLSPSAVSALFIPLLIETGVGYLCLLVPPLRLWLQTFLALSALRRAATRTSWC